MPSTIEPHNRQYVRVTDHVYCSLDAIFHLADDPCDGDKDDHRPAYFRQAHCRCDDCRAARAERAKRTRRRRKVKQDG